MTEKHLLSPRGSHSGLKASYSGVHHLTSNPVFKTSKSLNFFLFILYKFILPPPFFSFQTLQNHVRIGRNVRLPVNITSLLLKKPLSLVRVFYNTEFTSSLARLAVFIHKHVQKKSSILQLRQLRSYYSHLVKLLSTLMKKEDSSPPATVPVCLSHTLCCLLRTFLRHRVFIQ